MGTKRGGDSSMKKKKKKRIHRTIIHTQTDSIIKSIYQMIEKDLCMEYFECQNQFAWIIYANEKWKL